jgi:hypothetical protein
LNSNSIYREIIFLSYGSARRREREIGMQKTRIRFICVAQITLNYVYEINSSSSHKNVSGPKQRCLFFAFILPRAQWLVAECREREREESERAYLHILITECKRRRRPVSCNCPPRSLIFELLIKQSNTKISPSAQLLQLFALANANLLRYTFAHCLLPRPALVQLFCNVIYGLLLNYTIAILYDCAEK